MNDLKVHWWPIDKPVPYARNSRKIPERAIDKVAASIKEFGFRQCIVVDKDGVIICGHTRWLAAKKLGLREVPVHVADNLTPAQVKAYRLMDNRSHQETDWDLELLGPELEDLKGLDFDLSLTGFDRREIDALLLDPNGAEDDVPPVPDDPVTQPGEAWQRVGLLLHQIIVWVKARPVLTRSHFMWQHEVCAYGWRSGKMPSKPPANSHSVWTIDQIGESDGIHPTQKPVELARRPILYQTQAGDICYEPFSGSGTTIAAAELTGRRCYAMEISPAFVDVAVLRWQALSGQQARLEASGRTFDEVKAERMGVAA